MLLDATYAVHNTLTNEKSVLSSVSFKFYHRANRATRRKS